MTTIRSRATRLGHFLFFFRNYLFPLTFLTLILTTQPELLWGSEQLDWWMDIVGIGVALAGQSCRVLAIGCSENIRRGGRQKRVAAKTLIRHGIFAHSRNPLYFGNLLIIVGLGLIANNRWWYLLILPGFVGVYWAIVLAEEDFLAKKFGPEYAGYCQAVNRFVPTLAGLHRSLVSCSFDWKRVLRKEYNVACSWLSMAIGLLVWERWEQFGYTARKVEIQQLLLLLLLVAIVYVGAVWLQIRRKTRSTRVLPS
jgi:protein-S-isoprenylcysteine O-methyltransferase Ste14